MAETLVSSTPFSVQKGVAAGVKCFQLTYQSLEGYANFLSRKTEKNVAVADYHLRSCIFHTTSKQFIGRFHDSMPCGLVESLQSGAVICPIEQNAFFYSLQVDPSLILVTELTATFLSGSEERCVCLGWAMLPVIGHHTTTASTMMMKASSLAKRGGVRLALYEGSPRALYSMGHPGLDSKDLVPIPGCILTCALQPHPTLAKACHLFPANVLVSYNDIIPGLAPTRVHEAFPKLVRTTTASLEKVSLLLLPSVDDFEERLIAMVADDLLNEASADSAITIEERRLKVLLYNGWHFTGPPSIGFLEKASPSARASLRSSGYGLRSNLVLKGSMELTDIISHPLMEVVLQLEYVVRWSGVAIVPASTLTRSSRGGSTMKHSSTHSTTLTLCWAAWQPCMSEVPLEEECQAAIDLKSGPGFKPTIIPNSACNACYQGNLGDAGKVTFKFVPSRSSCRMEGSQLFEDLTSRKPSSQLRGEDMPDTGEGLQSRAMQMSSGATREPRPSPPRAPITSSPPRKGTSPNEELVATEISHHHPAVEVKPTMHPVVAATPTRSPHAVSRSILAYLHSAGYEVFCDIQGNPLPTIDPHTKTLKDHPGSGLDSGPYQITVQLLAYSISQSVEVERVPTSLLLSFQFFSFPPATSRARLVRSKEGGSSLPLILQPADSENQVGISHHYGINHVTLPTRSDREDLTHLLLCSRLTVNVFDGDSLMPLGTAALPLEGLLSQEKNHFQFTLCSPITLARGTADPTLTTVPMVSRDAHVAGKLYVRLARLPMDNKNIPQPDQPAISSSHSRLARRLYGSNSQKTGSEQKEDDLTRKRKHARMCSVREMRLKQKVSDVATAHEHPLMVPPSSSQLNMVEVQREELKHDRISSILEEALTSSYLLYPRMGRVTYFEHKLRNTHNHPLSVTISWKDPDLKLVTDRSECHHLRQLHSINTAIDDDNLITESPASGGQFGFFVHPGETISIPFKYQSFRQPSLPAAEKGDGYGEEEEGSRTVKVYFQASRRDLVGILNLRLRPRQQRVDRTFHFYHPEKTFLKRRFELHQSILAERLENDVRESSLIPPEIFVCTSDPDNVCEIKQANESRVVLIKAPVKPAPVVHSFFVMVYSKKYMVSPTEVWQIFIHSVHRVDHSLVMGQSSTLRLTLHGNHTNRRVACYSFSIPVMKVVTPSPFLLTAHSLTEVEISIKTHGTGYHHIIVTAVDVDSRQLVDAWLVSTNSQEPGISRAFQITLSVGDNTPQKTISFTNPYPKTKKFSLSTNHPGLVSFSNTTLKLLSQETALLGLQFSPSPQQLSADVLVFINDELDQTEECFLVKTLYTKS